MGGISSLINRLNLLKQIPIFEKLNWFELQKVARKSIVIEFKKGELISKEGDPPDYFYCLVSGRLQAYSMTSSGEKDNVDFIHRGMHFGIISVLTGENHSMTFEAMNDSIVLKIPVSDFRAILKTVPNLGIELSQHLSRRIRRKVKGSKSIFESTVIAVYSPIKGTGSSTYAANLAFSLQNETKKKVILVNIYSGTDGTSPKPPAEQDKATPYWKKPAIDLSQLVVDHEKILENVVNEGLKIDLLHVKFDPGNKTLKDEIGTFVSAFIGDYHYVVVDLPNEMDDIVLETLTQSDTVHLITSDRKKDLESIRRVLDRLQMTLKDKFREEQVRVIVRSFHDHIYLTFEEINQSIDFRVYGALPSIEYADLTETINTEQIVFSRSHNKSAYAQAVTRIARQIGGVSIGLVLGGGAALGVAHIGVIRVLEQEDIPVDIIVGSSMGALVGALWSIGNGAAELEAIAREFEGRFSKLKLIDPPIFPVSGLIRGHAIKRWLKGHYGARTFYNVRIPLKVVAYDLIRREEIVIESGSIVEAVRKSIAIPGVIRPIKENDQLIIDGGVLNPLPTNVLASRGIKKIIAVNVLQSPEDVSEGFDITKHQFMKEKEVKFFKSPFKFIGFHLGSAIVNIFNPNISDIIIQTLQASEHVISEQSAQLADVVIHPDLVGIKWYQLDRVDDLIKRGEEATRNLLPAIKKLIEE